MSTSAYPWLPDWYLELYGDTIDTFWRYVAEIQVTARKRGFDIYTVARTQPQIGSAGTVTFHASCSVLNFSSTQLFDDRVILSFGGDHLRFLRWWLRTDACARFDRPAQSQDPQQIQAVEWKGRPGWRPNRQEALVLAEGLGKLR